MAALITRVRELIGDAVESDESHFSDDQIQSALDARSRHAIEVPLTGALSRTSLGAEQYLDWHASIGAWESNAILLNGQLVPIDTEDFTADALNGIWTFDATQDEVYVTGRTFDLYGTAADLLDEWAISTAAGSISAGGTITEWETDGQKVKRAAATSEERRSLASQYRAKSLPGIVGLQRTDMNPEPMGPWGLR